MQEIAQIFVQSKKLLHLAKQYVTMISAVHITRMQLPKFSI